MAFKPEQYDSGKLVYLKAANTQTFAKFGAVKNASGYITPAASGDNTDVKYVSMEAITTSGTDGDLVLCLRIGGVTIVADTSNTPTQAQMMTAVDLSAVNTIDTSAVTDQVFFAESIVGAAADKKVRGWFLEGVVNS